MKSPASTKRKSAKRVMPAARDAARVSKPSRAATKSKSAADVRVKIKPGAVKAKASKAPPQGKPPDGERSVESASLRIDQLILELPGWRGETLARMRALILEADPEMMEEVKWMGTPVWSHHGIVCTGEAYKTHVKHTFARGAKIPDPAQLFNSSLEGNTRRAIDIHEGEKIDAGAFKALVRAAVGVNAAAKKSPAKKR